MIFIMAIWPTAGTLLIINFLSELQSEAKYAGGVVDATSNLESVGRAITC